jgi:hypothetical protein
VAVPNPDGVDRDAVLACIPIGEKTLALAPGGMSVPGIEVPCFAPGVSNIVVACAALTVSIETDPADGSDKQACGCAAKAI